MCCQNYYYHKDIILCLEDVGYHHFNAICINGI